MEDHLGTTVADEIGELRRADVEAVEAELAVALRARLGEVGERARRQVVDGVDVAPFGEEPVDERRADEARRRP